MHVLQLSIIPGAGLLSHRVCMCSFIIASFANGCTTRNCTNAEKLRTVLYLSPHPPSCFYKRKHRAVTCSESERSGHLTLHLITFPLASKRLFLLIGVREKDAASLSPSNFPPSHSYALIIFHMVPGWNSRY